MSIRLEEVKVFRGATADILMINKIQCPQAKIFWIKNWALQHQTVFLKIRYSTPVFTKKLKQKNVILLRSEFSQLDVRISTWLEVAKRIPREVWCVCKYGMQKQKKNSRLYKEPPI